MSLVQQQLEEQRASNLSGLPHFAEFAGHRARQSALIAEACPPGKGARLCVLGAGNAYDLELEALLATYQEVHLVDIDAEALARAHRRVPERLAARLLTHAPLDLSGVFSELERWSRLEVTPRELVLAPAQGAKSIAARLPGPFDVVASTCLLTQLQLSLLGVIGARHQLFVALRELLTLTHLRTLAALTAPGGTALLITDLCGDGAFPVGRPRDEDDLKPLMAELVAGGQVIYSAHPGLFEVTLHEDPVLRRAFGPARQSAPWLWQNGPAQRFLVYGLVLPRK